MNFEDIDVSTKEGQYLVAAVDILFGLSETATRNSQIMDEVEKRLKELKVDYPEKFPELDSSSNACIGCGLGIEPENSLGLCNSCQWDALSGYNGGAQC